MMVATKDMERFAPVDGPEPLRNAILIAGPTASGKSALALEAALATGAEIVNADSMQVYSVLDVLTARPPAADLAAAPHRLYGYVPPDRGHSTGAWLRDVARLAADAGGRRHVFVGGTGLYFNALAGGLSHMPDIAADIREAWRERLRREGADALHAVLRGQDPESADRIRAGDGQRIVRALEILDQTGQSLSHWRSRRGTPLVDMASARCILVEPDRAMLHRRIEARFEAMVSAGAIEEVRALVERGLDPALPAMKAIGVRELAGVLRGEVAMAEALDRAKAATRQYAKRQMTWFRNQFGPEWRKIDFGTSFANIDLPLPE